MAYPESSQSDRVLLVEGRDDKHVVMRLRERRQDIPEFCVKDMGGIDKLLPAIGPELKVSGRRVVGILVDANDRVEARWQAVTGQLRDQNLQPPRHPEPAGMIIDGRDGSPRVGIWLMPDNQSTGELEDFVQKMIPRDDVVWPLSEAYIDSIPAAEQKFTQGKILRAKVHAWLATRDRPRLMGAAIHAGDLNLNEPNSERFASWLQRLFT